MRPITMTALATLITLAPACDQTLEGTSPTFAQVTGLVTQVDPDDPDSEWIGTEEVRIYDVDGETLCEGEVDMDAIRTGDDRVTLDVIRSELRAIGAQCQRRFDERSYVSAARYMRFEPNARELGPDHGRLLTSDSPSGPWHDYAGGIMVDGHIAYHQTLRSPRQDLGEPNPDIRDLPNKHDNTGW